MSVKINGLVLPDAGVSASIGGEVIGGLSTGGQVLWRNPTPLANDPFTRLAALGGQVIEFNASAGFADLYEHTPADGMLLRKSPAGMFVDSTIYWIERVRVILAPRVNGGDTFQIHNGDSNISSSEYFSPMPDDAGIYVVDLTQQAYVILQANAGEAGSSYSNWLFNSVKIRAFPSTFTLRPLANHKIVVAVSPQSSYSPYQ